MQQKHEIKKNDEDRVLEEEEPQFNEILDAEVEIAEFICHHDVKEISGDPEKKILKRCIMLTILTCAWRFGA